jgi:hypothetical protein
MGCDGGTIPTRDELVKLKKKPEQKDKDSSRLYRWQHCAITQEPLKKPVVACEMGRLYNKEAVIELLLNKSAERSARNEHLEKLKDVVELDLSDNPAYEADRASVGDGMYVDKLVAPWICTVTGLEMNGRFKFVFAWTSGKVVSERAVKILQKDEGEADKFKEEDIIILNPEGDDLDLMHAKMVARRARIKAEKKAAKEMKKKRTAAEMEEFKKPATVTSLPDTMTSSWHQPQPVAGSSSSNSDVSVGSSTKSSTDAPIVSTISNGVSNSDEYAAKKRKKSNTFGDQTQKTSKKSTASTLTVQEDPKTSEIYKSLFSSHKSAQNKPTGHWITFDPRYN